MKGGIKRHTWDEMITYWREHSLIWSGFDDKKDPEGLSNVCHSGAPLYLNKYYAKYQKLVYLKLLSEVVISKEKPKALDIGCGAGRWCNILSGRKFIVTGIDLQKELIERNKKRYLHCNFFCTSIQDFNTTDRYDLISSVTVVQHIPFQEQDAVLSKIRKLICDDGYALLLENICDQDLHVFSHSIDGWKKKFSDAGFSVVAIQRYDYSPFLRIYRTIGIILKNIFRVN